MKNMRNCLLVLVGLLFVADSADAGLILSTDWDDGTTQGWTASTTQSNVANRLYATNRLNGSLQINSPVFSGSEQDWSQLDEIRFDLEIASFSAVSSPSDLTTAWLRVYSNSSFSSFLQWDLDLTGLNFGDVRTFAFSASTAVVTGSQSKSEILSNVRLAGLLFAKGSPFVSNSSSAYLDNFTVSSVNAVPEPSTLAMGVIATLLVIGGAASRRMLGNKIPSPVIDR